MRVSHKMINEMVSRKLDTISDKEFFLSRAMSAYFTDIVEAITGRFGATEKIRVCFIWESQANARIAWTDGDTITINADCHFTRGTDRLTRFYLCRGLMLHEVAHILYTDFELARAQQVALHDSKKIYPVLETREENVQRVQDMLVKIKKPQVLSYFYRLLHKFLNILEDAYINDRIMYAYPGYRTDLLVVLYQMREESHSYSELKKMEHDSGLSPHITAINMIHQYALYGECKCDAWNWKDSCMQSVLNALPSIDQSIHEHDPYKRTAYQIEAFSAIMDIIEPYIDQLLKRFGNDEVSDDEDLEELNDEQLNNLKDATEDSANRSKPVCSPEGQSYGNSESECKEDSTSDSNSLEKSEAGNTTTECSMGSKKYGSETFARNESYGNSEKTEDEESEESTTLPLSPPVREEMASALSEKNEGMDLDESSLDKVLDELTKYEREKMIEEERQHELNDFAAQISQPSIYDDFSCKVTRLTDVNEQNMIDYEKTEILIANTVRRMVKQFQKILEKSRKTQKMSNLYVGRKLECGSVIRRDGKCFSKRKLPSHKQKLSVALLVDSSGSMYHDDRIEYSKIAALLLYEFCDKLNIPVGVFGHHTLGGVIRLSSLAEFDKVDNNDRYRIMSLEAGGGNQDGYAIRYVAERLLADANAECMLLIVISDGLPNGGDAGEEDIAGAVKYYSRKNITTISAAIGEDKENIQKIYRDNYLDISSLNDLPDALLKIVKPYVKKAC